MLDLKIVYEATDNLIKQAVDLDCCVFDEKNAGVYEKCKEWISVNKDIYTFLLDGEKVVGYINFMPLTNFAYNKYLSGKITDADITKEDITLFKKGNNKCLFVSLVLDKSYRKGLIFNVLWNGFLTRFNELKNKGIFVSKIVMDCVSWQGEVLAQRFLKAKFVTLSKVGRVYEVVV